MQYYLLHHADVSSDLEPLKRVLIHELEYDGVILVLQRDGDVILL